MTEKYLAFGFDTYYPMGGMDDLFGIFETFDECQAVIAKKSPNHDHIIKIDADGNLFYAFEDGTLQPIPMGPKP
ncbi:MAG: hypothetical protein PHW33_04055 [Candidatus Portnoybacteria bacterium]|nr:hypothetical protein [Candidatus Portnoybacteria bacterium]